MRKIDWFLYFPLGVATAAGYAAQGLYLVAALVALSQLLIWHIHLSRDRAARDKTDLWRGRPDRSFAKASDWSRNAVTRRRFVAIRGNPAGSDGSSHGDHSQARPPCGHFAFRSVLRFFRSAAAETAFNDCEEECADVC